MSRADRSVAMTESVAVAARRHLLRRDGQEDVCFALWRPSTGRSRQTALVERLVLPGPGDRAAHGNASFAPAFLERALAEASREGAGLALLHSHPAGKGWQGMSRDDVAAEQSNAGAVLGATRRPFVGLTVAGDGSWSGRFWERTAPRTYVRRDCATVREIGERMRVYYYDRLAPQPRTTGAQVRTVSSWGDACQSDLTRLRVGLIGAGSVGGIVGDVLGRTGFEDVLILDFDRIEEKNLDRLLYATRADIGALKAERLARHLELTGTAEKIRAEALIAAVYEEAGFRAALDCDVLVSCVDRPWGRYVLNLIAYAHLIPVFDGGIAVRANKLGKLAAADWRAHTATPTRPCLQCLGQYNSSDVQLEREGFLDDPAYISGLPKDHPLKMRENVYAFAMSCGSLQVLQMLAYVVAPLGLSNPRSQLYHFVGSELARSGPATCHDGCAFTGLIAKGDDCGVPVTGLRPLNTYGEVPKIQKASWWRTWLPRTLTCRNR